LATHKRLLIAALVLLLGATGVSLLVEGSPAQSAALVLVHADPASLRNADPAVAYDAPSAQTVRAVYEGLVTYKGSGPDIEPVLATSWESLNSGMVWRFHLRRGVKFHDGTAFDANAVKFSLDRFLKIGKGGAGNFQPFLNSSSVGVVDPYTVEIRLTKAYGPFIETMASEFGPWILSPAAVNAHAKNGDMGGDWLKFHDAGTGAYTIQSVTPGQEVVMVAFKDYWRGWAPDNFTKVIIRTVPETATRRMLLERGDAQLVNRPSPDDADALKRDPKITVYDQPEMRNLWIVLNTRREPLTNKTVRHALSYAFDYRGFVEQAEKGYATQARGPIPSRMWGWDPALPQYSFDLQKAKTLLAEAGYPRGNFSMQIWHLTYDDMRRAAEIFQAGLQQLGVDAKIQQVTGGALFDTINTADPKKMPDAFTLYWIPDFADPLNFLYPPFSATQIGNGGFNGSLYNNPAYDALLGTAFGQPDRTKRIAIYKKAQLMLVEDAPHLWLADLHNIVGMSASVTGYVFNPYLPQTFDYHALRVRR